jgi:hypothetical protein
MRRINKKNKYTENKYDIYVNLSNMEIDEIIKVFNKYSKDINTSNYIKKSLYEGTIKKSLLITLIKMYKYSLMGIKPIKIVYSHILEHDNTHIDQ